MAGNIYNDLMLQFWLILGCLLVVGEFIIPGLVVMFIGLGAMTVAGLLHYGVIESVISQFLTFFVSSMFYIFTLRFAVLYFYPCDTEKKNLEQELSHEGQTGEAVSDIAAGDVGSIKYSQSQWQAKNITTAKIEAGDKVEITGQENITLLVQKKDI